MSKGNKLVILFAYLVVLYSACKEQKNNFSGDNQNTTDTVSLDVPLNKKGEYVKSYYYKNKVTSKMALDNIEKGFDSIQIRIWHGYSFNDSAQLFLLKKRNGKWEANLFLLKFFFNENRDSLISVSKDVKNKVPKSGWNSFTKEIFDFGIADLPDMFKVAPDLVMADGNGISVEISTRNRYRFYRYQDPYLLQDKLPTAKKMEQILQLIEIEFDFKRLNNN